MFKGVFKSIFWDKKNYKPNLTHYSVLFCILKSSNRKYATDKKILYDGQTCIILRNAQPKEVKIWGYIHHLKREQWCNQWSLFRKNDINGKKYHFWCMWICQRDKHGNLSRCNTNMLVALEFIIRNQINMLGKG